MKYSTRNYDEEADALKALVADFAEQMLKKLLCKLSEDSYGWDDGCFWDVDDIRWRIVEHTAREDLDPVDIANFAAFAWNLQQVESKPFGPDFVDATKPEPF